MNLEQARPAQSERLRFWLWLLAFYYVPVALIWAGVIPFAWRYPVLIAAMLGMLAYVVAAKRDRQELGLRRDTLRGSLCANGLLTAAGMALLIAVERAGWTHGLSVAHLGIFYPFYVLFSSPTQEFLFRSALYAEMRRAGLNVGWLYVLVSALTFSWVHVIYHNPLTLAVTFGVGALWAALYARWPNFWGVALSHALLGATAITTGLITSLMQ